MTHLAIVHPSDLVASELRQSLGRRRELWQRIELFSSLDDEVGTLTEIRGVAAMVAQLEPGSLDAADLAFFGGPIEANRSLLEKLPAGTEAVLLSLDAEPGDGHPLVAGVNLESASSGGPFVSPHPSTVALAHLLHPLRDFGLRRAVATVLMPVSTHDKEGLDELLNQTRAILAFASNPPREIFDVQMAFNVVPTAIPGSRPEAQLRTVLGLDELPISIHLIEAGIFHSLSTSLYVELAEDPGAQAVRAALGGHPLNDLMPDPELLGPIDAAARDEVLVGAVEPAASPGAYRIWAVMDNLTCGGALNAIRILEAVAAPVTH